MLKRLPILLDIYLEYVSQFTVVDDIYTVKISRGIIKHVYKVILLRFVKVRHKIPLITNKNKFAMSGTQFVPIGIPTICCYAMPSNCTYMFSMRKVKASHNSAQE